MELSNKLNLEYQDGTQDFKQVVMDWSARFAGYRSCYPRIRNLHLRLRNTLTQIFPEMLDCFVDPPSRPQFNALCDRWASEFDNHVLPSDILPSELCCWYLLTGFNKKADWPLFGMLECYDMFLGAFPRAVEQLELKPANLKHHSMLVAAPYLRMALKNTDKLKRGNIWLPEDRGFFIVADTWSNFLENYILLLERGIYQPSPRYGISKWPAKGIPEATTRDLKVTAAHVHHPSTTAPQYLFMYYITLSMDPEATRNKSKLTSRHWRCTDQTGKVSVVDGPGVIGEFPEIGPGDGFSYSSCCPFPTPGGTMEGYFTMQDLSTGETWDCTVPRMTFTTQKTITAATVAAGELQTS
jgi:ApaG protein